MFHLRSTVLAAVIATGAMAAGNALAENRIDTQRHDAPELSAYGEYKVGVRTLEMVNPGQIDILAIDPAAEKPAEWPRYDRPLSVEVWYPAESTAEGSTELKAYLRDGKTEVKLVGQAMREAAPLASEEALPLVIISHGYPGNRFLLAHLAENIASKGYVVASIDHTDSTYRTRAAFGSTLVNRSLDQTFVLGELARLAGEDGNFLNGLADADNAAVIGYSMGGYGAIITAGGGVTQAAVDLSWGGPHGTLGVHLSGSDSHNGLPDPRIKTIVAFGPWGMERGFWDAETLKGIKIPSLFIAGSIDDVSGYEKGVRAIWQGTSSADRSLLTFDNANHNAGAPMPAPAEADKVDADLGFNLAEHYNDAVWDSVRMNNISQHFVTAWLGHYLKGDETMAAYLDLTPPANDGVWAREDDGTNKPEHTHWNGFQNRTAKGLRYEVLKAGE
ncbi:putative dienelactone hydrolase [Hoeflea phototrophica DFL-43]|uniref:Putative dienelactone hydrolase n=1 Tax=Hoeflea phototrophica (strain DSM 17068 / NCIMB 14078 / DFL-43) TaxID=411684 RepID=A9DDR1_HOEPD|nr:dienelactone hydrolase [Hoeflea phototrophica]EDQ32118.1 putative dienelactone hydrolase [Hoeflea phototrophica DFL-43]